MNYKVGDTIYYEPLGGGVRKGVVTLKEADIKKGRPGFDMLHEDGNTYWGYDDQIIKVEEA